MKIDLYLNGKLVEINQDIDFVLNKQFTDLTDLTSIIVDYSKTIKVPMTAHNNELFSYAYKFEMQVVANNDIITYDPTKKIPMTMTFNGSTVMDGYAILNSINLKDNTYEINLYGQLGKIFYDLKEKPLLKYKPEDEQNINGFWKSINMNNRTIRDSFFHWDRTSSSDSDWNSTDWTNFWGFAPQLIGKTDAIDTKTYEVNTSTEADRLKTFVDAINTTRGITYADTYVGDGLDFNQYQELRTYMTRPYVYVDSLLKLVQNEINNGDYDGYSMIFDQDWFNDNNPYYKNLCYFPGKESIVDSGNSSNGMVTWDNSERQMSFPQTFIPDTTAINLDGYTYSDAGGTLITISNSNSGEETNIGISLNCDGIVVRDRVTGVGDTTDFNQNGKWAFYNLANPHIVPIRYIGIYDSSDQLIYKLYLCDDTIHCVKEDSGFLYYSHTVLNMPNIWNMLKAMNSKVIVPNTCTWTNGSSSNNYCEVTQGYNFGNVVLPTNSFRFKVGCDKILIDYYGTSVNSANIPYSEYKSLCPFKNDSYKNALWTSGATFSLNFRPIPSMNVTSDNYRSGSIWSILDVLGNDFNPFTWMIDYAKRFRLFFDIDYNTKTITLKSGYFNSVEYKKVDVDYGKEVIVEPIVDKYKGINYGYKAGDGKKATKYYKNYGVQYGDMYIETGINLNNETLSLTPNSDEGVFIPADLSCLTFYNLNSQNPIAYRNPFYTNKMINTLDKDGKIEYFPFYAFRLTNIASSYWLTDDTPGQKNTGRYCYLDRNSGWDEEQMTTQGGNPVYYLQYALSLPQFDNYMTREVPVTPDEGDSDEPESHNYLFWTTFGVPKEVYNGYLPSNIDNYSIYSRWQNYLNEIFSVQNKKVTCYVRMSYPDFINFKFNQLFVIDDNVFLVNKIIDFNPNSTEPTKVELIEIGEVANLR